MTMGPDPVRRIETLVQRGETLAGLERLLRLSPGYLSKVRRGRVTASAQLAALLEVLVRHPEVRATLASSAGHVSRPAAGRASRPAGLGAFLGRLARAWEASGVRFHGVDDLLLAALDVAPPPGLEPSARFLVHPDDRHALADARALGASVSAATSCAFVCAPKASRERVIVVFPLPPFLPLFERPALSPTDAALYFALQSGEEAELRFRAVAAAHALSRDALARALADGYGAAVPLPAREWLLRAMFDPELARQRLTTLPRRPKRSTS